MAAETGARQVDVAVVGAGMGGIYALHKFREQGLDVVGIEGGSDVGGVWFHNRYPGARVDIESLHYTYYFSDEIYREWEWKDRFAPQPELLKYLNFCADKLAIRPLIHFDTWMTAARWQPEPARWRVETSAGKSFDARFLIMATGNLSIPRKPPFEGLDDFRGEWVRTSRWPDREVRFAGRKVAVIGTGSTAVQAIPLIAEAAEHLTVFQRSPNYSVPARNRPIDQITYQDFRSRVAEVRVELLASVGGNNIMEVGGKLADYSDQEVRERLERQWQAGGHGISYLFADQETNAKTNQVVSEFVRSKIREIVRNQEVAESLCPYDHGIGMRRLCLDTNYYDSYNRPNVTLVDVRKNPIERITPTGIQTSDGHHDVDLIVFAIGFEVFTGALNFPDIRNAEGARPTDGWKRGPRTMLGTSTAGFPNFFFLCGPGGPSLLANFFLLNEYDVDWVSGAIAYVDAHGYRTIEPTEAAQDAWTAHVADLARGNFRHTGRNFMTHFNEDGSSVVMTYLGGINGYVERAEAIAASGYEGFALK
jgi:cation diffusion facilitator CzcD-associated flavoprotein CzcO